MEHVILVKFPYTLPDGKGGEILKELSLQVLGGLVPIKPITDALQMNWEMQRAKLVAKTAKGLPAWEVHKQKCKAVEGKEREQHCLRLETLQRYLDGMRPTRSKIPGTVQHFQKELVDTIITRLSASSLEPTQQEGEDETPSVINVDHPLTTSDHVRKALGGVLHPDDLKWFFETKHQLVLGMNTPDMVSITGEVVPGKPFWMTVNHLDSADALEQVTNFLVKGKGRIISPRDVYTPGDDVKHVEPRRIIAEVQPGVPVTFGAAIPKEKVNIVVVPEREIAAPWSQQERKLHDTTSIQLPTASYQ